MYAGRMELRAPAHTVRAAPSQDAPALKYGGEPGASGAQEGTNLAAGRVGTTEKRDKRTTSVPTFFTNYNSSYIAQVFLRCSSRVIVRMPLAGLCEPDMWHAV
jgi:hypothetical protein